MEILHRDSLQRGGFAGLRETRMVMDRRVFHRHAEPGTWDGIGNFVYLADAQFLPHGETRLHGHKEIDVISVMVDGRIAHEGSLEHGQEMGPDHVQVQRAGGEGFSHNEINPDATENRMIQIWVMPDRPGEHAGYKLYRPEDGELTKIYGGSTDQIDTFDSHTSIHVGNLLPKQTISLPGSFLAYLTRGSGQLNGETVHDGDLIRGDDLVFEAADQTQIIVAQADYAT